MVLADEYAGLTMLDAYSDVLPLGPTSAAPRYTVVAQFSGAFGRCIKHNRANIIEAFRAVLINAAPDSL